MKFKKSIFAILMAGITAFVMTGCGGSDVTTNPNDQDPIIPPDEVVTLVQIKISPENLVRLPIGVSPQYSAQGLYSDQDVVDITDKVTWSSSDETVVTIDATGKATTHAAGTATISAELEGVKAETKVNVVNENVTDLAAIQLTFANGTTSAKVPVGTSGTLVATAVMTSGATFNASSWVTFKASNPSVIEFGVNGYVEAVAVGTTDISAVYDNTTSNSVMLEVTSAVLQDIRVSPANLTLPINATQPYLAMGIFSDGSEIDITKNVVWSSSDTSIAIMGGWEVKTLAAGETTITATYGKPAQVTGSTTLTVSPATLSSIELTFANGEKTVSVYEGTTGSLVAMAKYSDGSTLDITDQASYTSTKPQIVEVESDGALTAVGVGSSEITATFDAVQSNVVTVNVFNEAIQYMIIDTDPDDGKTVVGHPIQLFAYGKFANDIVEDISHDVVWQSDNPKVVVSFNEQTGTMAATATGAETAQITATFKNVTEAVNLEFVEAKPSHLEIQESYQSDGNGKVITGARIGIPIVDDVNYDPVSLGAYYPTSWVVYDNGMKVYVNTETFWWSADQIRAYVNTIRGSFVFGRGVGSNIEISSTWRDGEMRASFNVDVSTAPGRELVEIGIKNTADNGWGCGNFDPTQNKQIDTNVGDRGKYLMACGKFHYDDGTDKWEDINNNVLWTSSDRNIAFVRTINGKLISASKGSAEISANLAGKEGKILVVVH